MGYGLLRRQCWCKFGLILAVIITIGPSSGLHLFCVYGMFGFICESEGCRQLPGSKSGLPEFAACPITFPRVDALRNPISVEKLHGPIVMITAGKREKLMSYDNGCHKKYGF